MLRFFSKYHKNQKGEGEGSLILVVIIICALVSAVFWFLRFVKDSKNEKRERAEKRRLEELAKKRKLETEKHEPKGYVYYYHPGINTKCKDDDASKLACFKCNALSLVGIDQKGCEKCKSDDECEIMPEKIVRPIFGNY